MKEITIDEAVALISQQAFKRMATPKDNVIVACIMINFIKDGFNQLQPIIINNYLDYYFPGEYKHIKNEKYK